MNTFIKVTGGYSKGGWGNYSRIYVVQSPDEQLKLGWWNRKDCWELICSGKLYHGSTENCQVELVLKQFQERYPEAVTVWEYSA